MHYSYVVCNDDILRPCMRPLYGQVRHVTPRGSPGRDTLLEPLSISSLFSYPIIARHVYISCLSSQKATLANLIELEKVDFDIILGMYWLHSRYESVDYRTRIVWFSSI